ncbi:MAG: aminotransferase class I/II-fold pyridoxal phosphate-dependent enzyme [Clostridiales bacterium]|jgi:lysine decarboxylase|nr:aminotransferase class I/II-fold pyridoxal phosphate-dependent enzyme [Clostridiales bacterium]
MSGSDYTGVYRFIKEYLKKDIYPFHMPGHKRNPRFLPAELMGMEITEFPGADNLLAPAGVIKELEERIARVFGAEVSFLMTNGSTGCLLAALMAVRKQGAKVLVARNCHKSVYSALVLSGMRPVYVYPEMTDINIAGGVSPAAIEAAFRENPGICAAVITSPTYEGFVSDVSAIAEITRGYGVPLIVDEAHGAGFNLSDKLPESAVACGADIVVHSLHKRMPMLSQTAVMHVKSGILDPAFVKKGFNLIQSTSPSYILMAQVDYALGLMLDDPGIMAGYLKNLLDLRAKLPKEGILRLVGEEYDGRFAIKQTDISKIVLYIDGKELSGGRIERIFAEDYGVQLELSGLCHVIAMTTPGDTGEGFNRLFRAVNAVNEGKISAGDSNVFERISAPPRPQIVLTPRDAFYEKTRSVKLSEALSLISAGFIIPYPPGIPLVAPGEIITSEILTHIKACGDSGINVIGADESIYVCEGD